jgi:hypothetical protein
MSDRLRIVFFVSALIIFIFIMLRLGSNAGAYTISNTRMLTLDHATLQKGFTVKSYDDKFLLPFFPQQYDKPVGVKVETLAQGTPLPEGKQAISNFYTYDIIDSRPGFLAQPALLSLAFTGDSLADKAIYFYDKHQQQWRALPTSVDHASHTLRAWTIFPAAQIVAVEDLTDDGFTAQSIVVADKDGQIIYEKNPNAVRPIASLTKLVSAAVFLEHNPGWDRQVTILESDNVGGASVPFEPGDVVNVKDLFFATLTGSKNNATRALMRSTGIPETEFVARMNQKVRSWGLYNTHFVEPTGLSEFNVSSAREVMEISRRVFNNFKFLEATTVKWYPVHYWREGELRVFWVKNTNKLVDRDLYVTGGKTGFTYEAGYNLVTQAKNSQHEIIALVLGAKISQNYEEVYILLKRFL